METVWKWMNLLILLLFPELCRGFPINLEDNSGGSTQFLTGVAAILITVGTIILAGCLCCQRRKGFQEFHNSPVVVSATTEQGHVNPLTNGEFTIFTPLQTSTFNNNLLVNTDQVIDQTLQDSVYGDIDVRLWFENGQSDFPRVKLKYIRELGNGRFGKVIEGAAQNLDPTRTWTPVVVKILDAASSTRERILFLNDGFFYLAPPHPNILALKGRCLSTSPLLLIHESCNGGDLKSRLRDVGSQDMTLQWCCQLTSALRHLHENGFIHPDLAARNCLLVDNVTLKLGDYGLSATKYPEDYYKGGEPLIPVRWRSPESLHCTPTTIQPQKLTQEANVWSLGVVMWEICEGGSQPYESLDDDEVISRVFGAESLRLEGPRNPQLYSDYLFRLMRLCWSSIESRPKVSQIDLMLSDLLQVHKNTQNVSDFDNRWESFKPNTVVKTDNHAGGLSLEEEEDNISKPLSPSLNNLHGSLDNLLSSSRTGLEFKLGVLPVGKSDRVAQDYSGQIDSFTDSLIYKQTGSSGSDTEEENWRRKVERGAYTEKVQLKSRSVADLMVLTHVDYSESEPETPMPSIDYKLNRSFRRSNLESSNLNFSSEGNLLSLEDDFQKELKKLQVERRDSLLFVPDNKGETSSNLSLLHDLNSPTEIKPMNQIYNIFNMTIDKFDSMAMSGTKLHQIINIEGDEAMAFSRQDSENKSDLGYATLHNSERNSDFGSVDGEQLLEDSHVEIELKLRNCELEHRQTKQNLPDILASLERENGKVQLDLLELNHPQEVEDELAGVSVPKLSDLVLNNHDMTHLVPVETEESQNVPDLYSENIESSVKSFLSEPEPLNKTEVLLPEIRQSFVKGPSIKELISAPECREKFGIKRGDLAESSEIIKGEDLSIIKVTSDTDADEHISGIKNLISLETVANFCANLAQNTQPCLQKSSQDENLAELPQNSSSTKPNQIEEQELVPVEHLLPKNDNIEALSAQAESANLVLTKVEVTTEYLEPDSTILEQVLPKENFLPVQAESSNVVLEPQTIIKTPQLQLMPSETRSHVFSQFISREEPQMTTSKQLSPKEVFPSLPQTLLLSATTESQNLENSLQKSELIIPNEEPLLESNFQSKTLPNFITPSEDMEKLVENPIALEKSGVVVDVQEIQARKTRNTDEENKSKTKLIEDIARDMVLQSDISAELVPVESAICPAESILSENDQFRHARTSNSEQSEAQSSSCSQKILPELEEAQITFVQTKKPDITWTENVSECASKEQLEPNIADDVSPIKLERIESSSLQEPNLQGTFLQTPSLQQNQLEALTEENEPSSSVNTPPQVAFDLSQYQQETMPNFLTHAVLFSSTPFGKKPSLPYSSLPAKSLNVFDDRETDLFSSNFVALDTNSPDTENKLNYSLETWDNFLGKSFDSNRGPNEDFFDSFSSEPQSMVFLDDGAEKNAEVRDKVDNGDTDLGETFVKANSAFTEEDKKDETYNVNNATFEIKDRTFGVEKKDGTFVMESVESNVKKEYFILESQINGQWESGGGWFLHPQSNSDKLNGDLESQPGTSKGSYIRFGMDDEIMTAIRNELLEKLPQAQGASQDGVKEEEVWNQEERNEVFLKYNVYNTPLSPIPEENSFDENDEEPEVASPKSLKYSESDSDWSEPCQLDLQPVLSSITMESPQKPESITHTPSQGSCCSNDTLFNFDDFADNKEHIADEVFDKDASPLDDLSEDNTARASSLVLTFEDTYKVEPIEQGRISEETIESPNEQFLNSERNHSAIYLSPFRAKVVAPLPSPEDNPWKSLPASLLTFETIPKPNLVSDHSDCSEPKSDVSESSAKEVIYDREDKTHEDVIGSKHEGSEDEDEILVKFYDDINVSEETNGSEQEQDILGILTDIRFSGPVDNQLMSTSFSESNDVEEQGWDSGSDTRSSSSGEFIWKEGEHEESLKALKAAPHDVLEDIQPMEGISEEPTESDVSTSSSDDDGDNLEFVPSAWDKFATPTKSALRSPEKSLERNELKPKGVWFKKQKYHCVYEYPREPESPVLQSHDLWKPQIDYITFTDWEFDTDTYLPPPTAESDLNPSTFTYKPKINNSRRSLYYLTSLSDIQGDGASTSRTIDDDFVSTASNQPDPVYSQFFPGASNWLENVTPDSGLEDSTPGSDTVDFTDGISSSTEVHSLKQLARQVVNKIQKGPKDALGGLRHTRSKLKLDLPPSPSAFTSSKTFSIEPVQDSVTREKPTFSTFGKSRFLVQHVDTPTDEDPQQKKNVCFDVLPYKPLSIVPYKENPVTYEPLKNECEISRFNDKTEVFSKGEANLLDSADEDSGIESSTLERKGGNLVQKEE
ncbi:uncharacterized protein [Euwallacea fornicatus]|uniref:uncharacterized protein isoform X2 n=1 Tax=Euwallacea fornicatus TaxID=995702 RepID=UPI00338D7562